MNLEFHQHGGSRLYSLVGRSGAAVLCVTLASSPISIYEIKAAGVHIPGSGMEPGECPYVAGRRCRIIHVSLNEKQEFVAEFNRSSSAEETVERHLDKWYRNYVRS